MYALLRNVQATTGVTILHVTHNPAEAEQLGDRVFLLRSGKVERRE
jgi:ABC-type sulfate/molybdate transport systems ATPase subunit